MPSSTVGSTLPRTRGAEKRNREETAISTKRRNILLRVFIVLSLLACAGSFPTFARPQPPPDQIELAEGWQLASARELTADGSDVSRPDYPGQGWHTIRRMPATVLEVLQNDGTYPDLYFGKNLRDEIPQDLYMQDWWYRTSFKAPAGHTTYLLELPGINYRAEVWLNGHQIAGNTQIVGMHNAHELDVADWIRPGESNMLAIKVTPEQALQDINGVELADSWWDWINWNYLGYQGPDKNPDQRDFICVRPECRHLEAGLPQGRRRGRAGPRRRQHRTTATANRFGATDNPHHRPQLLDSAGAGRPAGGDHARR